MKLLLFKARREEDRRAGPERRRVGKALAAAACAVIAGVAIAQNQVVGGHVLDSNLRQGSLGLNSTIYQPGTYGATVPRGGGPYGVGWGGGGYGSGGSPAGGLATPMYRMPQSARPAPTSYLYQSGTGGSSVLITGRRGATYVDPLASTMYTPLQQPVTVQRYSPGMGATTGVQIQPYGFGTLSSPLYSPYR